MLVRISTLEPWRGEPVPHETTEAIVVYQDGRSFPTTVDPYEVFNSLPKEVEEKWTDEELESHDLCRPVPFTLPEGKLITGPASYVKVKGVVHEIFPVEDAPAPAPEKSKAERLDEWLGERGLTKADLKELLAQNGTKAIK